MGEYCGWDNGDHNGEWLKPSEEISDGTGRCFDCRERKKRGHKLTVRRWKTYDEEGTVVEFPICEECEDLYTSLVEAGHEPLVGSSWDCAAEAAALRPYVAAYQRNMQDVNCVCVQCKYFNSQTRFCDHVDDSAYDFGETTYKENLADYDLRYDRWPRVGSRGHIPRSQRYLCVFWEE